ncbi:hypothetical protein DFH08DRAFT_967349 [Mycena albidolilacea]|uniref:Uncharacterized protein n=1 Tax=Mycena albidolilacea TaxID=1033008 RepID=A0AAD7EJN9_9AGAR|nr:hypothetical protein DFH08DRAFT_967349 [Mycena albidolilacea]
MCSSSDDGTTEPPVHPKCPSTSSVPALRSSIETDLQRELLKKRGRDKSLTQHQLNAILDPVACLPLEISSEIFLRSLDPFPEPRALHSHAPLKHLLLEGKPDEDVLASIRGHGERVRHLEICEADDPDRPQAIQILGDSNPETLPSLEIWAIRGSVTEFSEFSLHRICEVLWLAPNLVE